MHELDDLLPRRDAPQRVAARCPLLHSRREVPGNPEVDVRFEQGEAHLAQCLVYVFVGEAPLIANAGEDRRQLVRERVEHAAYRLPDIPAMTVRQPGPLSLEGESLP